MDSINVDFPNNDNKLPTLDTSIWVSRPDDLPPFITYEFFEKPTNSKYCLLEKSAMDFSSKMSILSNDLCRRMLNTDQDIPQARRNEIVDIYSMKLLRSGYTM